MDWSLRRAGALVTLTTAVLFSSCGTSHRVSQPDAPGIPHRSTSHAALSPANQTAVAWGATIATWNANHEMDPSAPTDYWPRLPDNFDSYSVLDIVNTAVIGFTYRVDPSVSRSMESQVIEEQLPVGVVLLTSRASSSCDLFVFSPFHAVSAVVAALHSGDGMASTFVFTTSSMDPGYLCPS